MKVKLKLDYQEIDKEYIYQLLFDKEYIVIGIEADDYRIINEKNRPVLHPPEIFNIIDETIPGDWVITYGEDGEQYAYPPPLNKHCFFEKYFDRDKQTIKEFNDYLKENNMI